MKKLFLFLMVALTAVCVSCSSDDDDVSFGATEIIAVPQAVNVMNEFYQYQVHYATLNIEESDVNITWDDGEGNKSTGDTLYFFPLGTGERTITATLRKGGAVKQLSKTIDVKENVGGAFALRGQSIRDAFSNETTYSALVYGKMPEYDVETYRYYVNNGALSAWHSGVRYKFYERQRNLYRAYECDNADEFITHVLCYTID